MVVPFGYIVEGFMRGTDTPDSRTLNCLSKVVDEKRTCFEEKELNLIQRASV